MPSPGGVYPDQRLERGDRPAALAVFLLLLAAFTATMSGLPDVSDAEAEFQTTSALVRTRSLALGGTPEGNALVAMPDVAPVRRGVDGRTYSWFGIGQAALATPLYALGTLAARAFPAIEARHAATTHYGVPRSEYFAHLFVGWRNPLLSAATAAMLYLVVRLVGASQRAAFWSALAYGLASFAWAQARSTLSDVQATFFVFAAFALLVQMRLRVRRGAPPRRWRLAGVGLALGGAFLTRVVAAPVVLVLALALLAVLRPRGRAGLADALWAAVPAALGLAAFLLANHARFGDALESGYGAPLADGFFGYPVHFGVGGLLFAPGKGLAWLAPPALLAPVGLLRARRRDGAFLPLLVLGVVVAVFAPIAITATWHGAWTYGPRYVLPALPCLWVGATLVLVRGRVGRALFGALAALGVATNLPGALVDHTTHQDLAMQAARAELGGLLPPELPEAERDAMLFQNLQWEWRYAAPWAHWRILAHRLRGQGETFSSRELFFVEPDVALTPVHEREKGFRHLAWVDLARRLDAPAWPFAVVVVLLCAGGIAAAREAFDPAP